MTVLLHVGIAKTADKIESAIAAVRQEPDSYIATAEETDALMQDG